MGVKEKGKRVLTLSGRLINEVISLIVFALLDLVDFLLCFVYKLVDFAIESEWRPCYCFSPKEAITATSSGGANILVSEKGETAKVMCLSASSSKLQLEDVSDTLFKRPSVVSRVTRVAVDGIWVKLVNGGGSKTTSFCSVEMLQGKIGGKMKSGVRGPRWSDCECKICNHSWIHDSGFKNSLFVRVDGAKESDKGREDVLFIHGFISSSKFWSETVFPNLSTSAKSKFRLFAVDLLGFGRSPKPTDSLYTLREHVEMIEKSVIEPYKVKDLHIVAHSLGCILALALAVKYPGSIKSLTLLAPPYFGKPEEGEEATQYAMRKVGPRLVWPPISFGASLICWYEHISRTICLILCKHHRFWEFLFLQLSRNRIKQYLLEGFWGHPHNASWHTLHNILCGTPKKVEQYLDIVKESLKCEVTIFHGQKDELIPVECSHNVKAKIPRARLNVIKGEDHITIIVGREMAFTRELEEVWRRSSSSVA